jgi:hypothetical protein
MSADTLAARGSNAYELTAESESTTDRPGPRFAWFGHHQMLFLSTLLTRLVDSIRDASLAVDLAAA